MIKVGNKYVFNNTGEEFEITDQTNDGFKITKNNDNGFISEFILIDFIMNADLKLVEND
jgi:hypothetical protein